MLPVANVPHIEHVLELLIAQDVRDVVLLTSYMADAFDETIRRAARRGMDVEVAVEDEPLGTAGAIRNAESFLEDDSFYVFNGDVLTDVDLGKLAGLHRDREAEATILLTPVDDPSAFGVVPTAGDGRVRGFIEKPPRGEAPTNEINAGVYVFEPSVLSRIPDGEVYSTERALFPGMVEEGAALFAFPLGSYWIDIGTPDAYLKGNLDALSGSYHTPAAAAVTDREVLLGEGSSVAGGARVSSVCLGARARIEEGAEVSRCVLLPGAVIGANARVRDSIIGERAVVEPGCEVVSAVVGDGERITEGGGSAWASW
jgi:mannose-1-phosphate guanylyltransferase